MSAIRRRHAAQGTAVEVTLQSDSNASSIPSSKTQDLTNQRLASVFLAVIATAIYANTLTAEFCYDDTFAIVNNKDVTGANPLSAIWTHDFWGQNITKIDSHKSYRPLTVLSFRLNHYWAGLAPLSYHAVNIALHAVVTVLAFNLFLHLSAEPVQPGVDSSFIVAFIAALFFALHPVHVEAVAGVVGRAELLCAIFYISSILIYKRSVSLTRTHWRGLILVSIFYICATLTKETGYTIIGVLLVYDIFSFGVPIYFASKSRSSSDSTSSSSSQHQQLSNHTIRSSALRLLALRVTLLLALAFAYLIIRKRLTVHFVVHNFRRVENPIAFQQRAIYHGM